jgi:hypothetical protein
MGNRRQEDGVMYSRPYDENFKERFVTYRGYRIERKWVSKPGTKRQPDEFVFSHEDYDGPEDRRIGAAMTLNDVIAAIDEKILESEEVNA